MRVIETRTISQLPVTAAVPVDAQIAVEIDGVTYSTTIGYLLSTFQSADAAVEKVADLLTNAACIALPVTNPGKLVAVYAALAPADSGYWRKVGNAGVAGDYVRTDLAWGRAVIAAAAQQAACEAAAALATASNVNIVGEPGELIVNAAGYVLRRTVVDGSVDSGSPARDLAMRQARGAAFVAGLKNHYPASLRDSSYADFDQVTLYGQSLGAGATSIPWYVDAVPDLKMPNGGPLPLDSNADQAISFASLADGVSVRAETGLGAFARMFAQLLVEENGVDVAASGKAFIGSSVAEGSRTIAALSTGPLYPRILANFQRGQAVAAAAGKRCRPVVVPFLQGENDYASDTAQATYETAQNNLQAAMQADARTATGDATLTLPMLIYQTATHPAYGRTDPKVAKAQLAVARSNPLIAMATPSYFIPFGSATEVHPFSLGYVWLMAHFGMAWKRWQVDGIKPMPLSMLECRRDGDTFFARFDVEPGRGLVLDSQTIAQQGNYGFTAADPANNPLTISNVRIIGPRNDWIAAKTTAALASGAKLRTGHTTVEGVAGRINLRDNSPVVFDPDDANLPMWKWPVIEERVVA